MNDEVISPNAIPTEKEKRGRNWILKALVGEKNTPIDPATDKQRRSLRYNTISEIKNDLARFDGLSNLDDSAKTRLKPLVFRHVVIIARAKFRSLERINSRNFGAAFLFILIAFVLAFLSPGIFGDGLSYGPAAVLTFSAFIWLYTLIGVNTLSYKELSEYLTRMQDEHRFWWVGLFFYFSAIYVDPGYPYDPKTAFGDASGFVSFLLIVVSGSWLSVHGLINLFRLSRNRQIALIPDSFIVVGYLQILYFLDEHPHCFSRAQEKRQILALIEQVATLMQQELPKPFHSGSLDADLWFCSRAGQMATAVRNLKTWVLAPKEDTEKYFISRIANDMSSVAQGLWDALPIDDSKPVQKKNRWVSLATALLRVIVTIVVILLATHSTKLEPHWVSANYTFLLVAFPVLVTLSERIDPVISPVITSYKETLKSFQEISKKPEH